MKLFKSKWSPLLGLLPFWLFALIEYKFIEAMNIENTGVKLAVWTVFGFIGIKLLFDCIIFKGKQNYARMRLQYTKPLYLASAILGTIITSFLVGAGVYATGLGIAREGILMYFTLILFPPFIFAFIPCLLLRWRQQSRGDIEYTFGLMVLLLGYTFQITDQNRQRNT